MDKFMRSQSISSQLAASSPLTNRTITNDIKFNVNPRITNKAKASDKLQRAIQSVARKHEYHGKWANSSMEVFAVGNARASLFQSSVDQNVVLWRGQNLVIHAAKWEWALARKSKRIAAEHRATDISDSVELLKVVLDSTGELLQRDTMKSWSNNIFVPIEDEVVDLVAAEFKKKYGYIPVADRT